ncbi:hypothetical protein HZC00_01480 [Candidatus Kaiserbacteria bacterium]|nr:hypothetical protein [Candidatus Kaiserbacteria bacterium]
MGLKKYWRTALIAFILAILASIYFPRAKANEIGPQETPMADEWSVKILLDVPKICNQGEMKKLADIAAQQWSKKNPDKVFAGYDMLEDPCKNKDRKAELVILYIPVENLQVRPINPDKEI